MSPQWSPSKQSVMGPPRRERCSDFCPSPPLFAVPVTFPGEEHPPPANLLQHIPGMQGAQCQGPQQLQKRGAD